MTISRNNWRFSLQTLAGPALEEFTLSQKCSKKKIQKSIDTKLALWDSPFTHGNIYTQLRTKTLLLSAAALVAGFVSAQAQSNVFSANVLVM